MARPTRAKALKRLRKALDGLSELEELKPDSPEFQKWRRNTQIAITNTFGDRSHLQDFRRSMTIYYQKGRLDSAASVLESMIEEIEEYWEPVTAKDVLETLSIQEEKEEEEEENQTPTSSIAQENELPNTNEVFVIHGRDEGTKNTVARFLEQLELNPVILADQPSRGCTIIEKFEQHAQVGFAVALLTPDDAGSLQDDGNTLNPRARQNVIFELGFFIGKLGRNRVCALIKGEVEIPSDYAGVVYIPLDDRAWKTDLVKELQSAGYNFDADRVLRAL